MSELAFITKEVRCIYIDRCVSENRSYNVDVNCEVFLIRDKNGDTHYTNRILKTDVFSVWCFFGIFFILICFFKGRNSRKTQEQNMCRFSEFQGLLFLRAFLQLEKVYRLRLP